MANLIYHAGTAGKIKQKEVTRAVCHTFRNKKGVFKSHGNKDIDVTLTKYNIDYDIKGYNGKLPDEIVKERLENEYRGKRTLRHDAVVLREIIANPSADVFQGKPIEEQRKIMDKFVRDAMPWFKKEFGAKNVVGASAHFDETNPHVHFAIMPMTDDGRIAQKEFFKGPADLKRQHKEFRKHMQGKKWVIAEENKYEDIDDFDLPVYKANGEKINKMRKEQTDAMRELAKDKDLRKEALEMVATELLGLGAVEVQKMLREEILRKQQDVDAKYKKADEYFLKVKQMYDLKQQEDERNKKEKPTRDDLKAILEKETDGRFSVYFIPNTNDMVLAEIRDGRAKRITEENLVRELTTQVSDGKGGVYLDLRGNEAVSYVLGHYGSREPKTRTEAHMDGLKAISKVHQQMAVEIQKTKYR